MVRRVGPCSEGHRQQQYRDLSEIEIQEQRAEFDGAFNTRKDEHEQKLQISPHPVAARRCAVVLRLAGLAGLPPAFLAIPECDLLAEQSYAMADRMKRGVSER